MSARAAPLFCALALCACATSVPVSATAVREDGDLRVLFRRYQFSGAEELPEIRVEGGRLDEIVFSADRLTVSALWREPRGRVTVRFPFGGKGEIDARAAVDGRRVEYVFLEDERIRVTARLPVACPVRPRLQIEVAVDEAVTLQGKDWLPNTLPPGGGTTSLVFPRDARGVLHPVDIELAVKLSSGRRYTFLVGVDPDGTPSAVTGFVRTLDTGVESMDGGR
jgi:hypothetical protein